MAYSGTNNKDTVYSYEQGNKYLEKWRSFVSRFIDDTINLGLSEEESTEVETSAAGDSPSEYCSGMVKAEPDEIEEPCEYQREGFFSNIRVIELCGEEEDRKRNIIKEKQEAVKKVPKNTYILAKILANKAECYYIVSTDDDATNPTATFVLANLTQHKLEYGTFLNGLDCVLNVDSIDRVSIIETLQVRDNTPIEKILDVEGVDALPIFCAN